MTLALRLTEAGCKVTLIESEARTGGLALPSEIGKYIWDKFYHVIVPSDSDLLKLIDMLGLTDRVNWENTKTGFFTDGHLYSMSNTMEFLTFPPLNLLDKFRLGWTIFYASKIKAWQRLEHVLVADWLQFLSGKRTLNKIWLPLLKSKLGEYYRITNASFIWAIIARMYSARKTSMKKESFGYADGGYATILESFQKKIDKIGVSTICNTPVVKIIDNGEGVELETVQGNTLKFEAVILTIPCSLIESVCPQLSDSEKKRLRAVIYEGVICAVLILKKPLAEYYVTNITDEGIPFTGVIEMTALVDKKYFDGNSLVYLPRYLVQEDPFWHKSDEEIIEAFLSALEAMYPNFGREDVLFWKVSRAAQVLPVTTLHYSTELLPTTRTSLKNVFVVNSAQIANGTMNVNEIIGLANRKAAEITDILQQ